MIDLDELATKANSFGLGPPEALRLIALARAGSRLAEATELIAEASTRLIGGKYVLRTRAGSNALEALFIALAAFREAQQGPTGDLNHTTQPE